MPVNLKQIPGKLSQPVPPDKYRWMIVIVLITLIGFVISLSIWPKSNPTHSGWFWFCSLVIPLSVGVICFALKLLHHENERDRIFYWNQIYQEQYDQHVTLGQQAVGLMGVSYTTPNACNKLAAALLQGSSQLHTSYSSEVQKAITSAVLQPRPASLNKAAYQSRLEEVLAHVIRMLKPELSQFVDNLTIRIRHDGILSDDEIKTTWLRLFPPSYIVDELKVLTEGNGLMWLDEWLDDAQATLVISVEINLFLQPRHHQAESVSAILLASPGWLRRSGAAPLSLIHRPVSLIEVSESLSDVARWGKLSAGIPYTFWRTQVERQTLSDTLLAMDKQGFLHGCQGDNALDDLFGMPGSAVGNIALICASEHSVATTHAQWLLIGDQSPHMAIVRPV
ncbi:hypothetical protein [Erwinia sorbitola]|uniref:Uncharacterized protein n=1 Tax=Erwinia sorbitola TaxID=2681984 RepID=A0A6I6EX34_9GAMM|nr:hypothetical protein [Erwinia sorbitola]QGU89182.1 hypothetical protein GN242_19015 [Erwinia sorbitola]